MTTGRAGTAVAESSVGVKGEYVWSGTSTLRLGWSSVIDGFGSPDTSLSKCFIGIQVVIPYIVTGGLLALPDLLIAKPITPNQWD